MLLDQLIDEMRGRIAPDSRMALLTPAGRETIARYINDGGMVMVGVDRAADIRQLLRWSKRHGVRIAIPGGAEAWKLAPHLAAAGVPVFVHPPATLPSDYDHSPDSTDNTPRQHTG